MRFEFDLLKIIFFIKEVVIINLFEKNIEVNN